MTSRTTGAVSISLLLAGALYGFGKPTGDATAVPRQAAVPLAQEFVGTTDVKFKAPLNNVWHICGQLALDPGVYRLTGRAAVYSSRMSKDSGNVSAIMALLTNPAENWSGETWTQDKRLVAFLRVSKLASSARILATQDVEEVVTLSTPTTYYLAIAQSEGGSWDQLQCLGAAVSPTIIRAERLG